MQTAATDRVVTDVYQIAVVDDPPRIAIYVRGHGAVFVGGGQPLTPQEARAMAADLYRIADALPASPQIFQGLQRGRRCRVVAGGQSHEGEIEEVSDRRLALLIPHVGRVAFDASEVEQVEIL